MDFITLEEFKKTADYQKFQEANPSSGRLKVEVFTAYQAIPVSNTEILVTKDIGDKKVMFFSGLTNSSGMISDIKLPSPPEDKNFKPGDDAPYTSYDVTAIHEGFEKIKKYDVAIFGNTGVIQYIKMIPEISMEGIDQNGS